jgi:hypothetical protein
MATNIDKALYQQPQGLDSLGQDEEPLEIEIVDPEEVHIHTDGLDIHMMKGEGEDDFSANLAEEMDPSALQALAGDLAEDVDNDKNSRKDWEKAYVEGLKLLGLQYEERTEPWNGACGVFHPMILRPWCASSLRLSWRHSQRRGLCVQKFWASKRLRSKKPPCGLRRT